jgi:hypothetical protein
MPPKLLESILTEIATDGDAMTGQRVGYIRVSTLDQNPERQLEGVLVDRVFTDQASGKDTHRPQLAALLSYIREGDTLVVHSMDRLAGNLEVLHRVGQGDVHGLHGDTPRTCYPIAILVNY